MPGRDARGMMVPLRNRGIGTARMSTPIDPASFAWLLRRHRIAAGLTQEQLAERAHLSARAVSDLERGIKHTPRRDTVALLAEALALSPAERAALEAAARAH